MATNEEIRAKDILPHKTRFDPGDGFYGDGLQSFFMEADKLLELTAQKALAGNVASAFVPNSTTTIAGKLYVYNGLLFMAKVDDYQGAWDASKFEAVSLDDVISKYALKVSQLLTSSKTDIEIGTASISSSYSNGVYDITASKASGAGNVVGIIIGVNSTAKPIGYIVVTNNGASDTAIIFRATSIPVDWITSSLLANIVVPAGQSVVVPVDIENITYSPYYLGVEIKSTTATLSIQYVVNDTNEIIGQSLNSCLLENKSASQIVNETLGLVIPNISLFQLLTSSKTDIEIGTASISSSYSNGVYDITASKASGAGNVVGIIIGVNSTSRQRGVIVFKNNGLSAAKFKFMATNSFVNWVTSKNLGTYTIPPNGEISIDVDIANIVADYTTYYLGIESMLADTATISVYYVSCSSVDLIPKNAINATTLAGKSFKDVENALKEDLGASGGYITCWGDSLTAMGGWTTRLQTLSGRTVYNAGTGGENVPTITSRQGADVMLVNGITIPASGGVQVADGSFDTELGKTSTPLKQGGGSHVNPCKIGDIKGTLTLSGNIYTFTRNEAGDAVTIERPTALRTHYDIEYNAPYIMIIFMGQNGGFDSIDDLVQKHRLMIEHSNARHFLVLGLSSGTAESRADYETAMTKEFGRQFLSLRQYLAHPIYTNGVITSCYGLADEGLTPTTSDLEEIAIGQVPSSLLIDSVHYTEATRTIIGNLIYKHLCELNIL